MRLSPLTRCQTLGHRRPRASFATLGCKVNQAETENLISQLEAVGFVVVNPGQPCDLFVFNSCSVTHIADRKSRQVIRQARRSNPEALIAVTGCFAQTRSRESSDNLGVDLWVSNADKPRLLQLVTPYVERLLAATEPEICLDLDPSRLDHNGDGQNNSPGRGNSELVTERDVSVRRRRAMVKIQDGCDNFCTYCIVPTARGPRRSVPSQEVLAAVERMVKQGYGEVVLTGVHAGAYGREPQSAAAGTDLASLIRLVLERTTVKRLRLSSIEPWDFDQRFLGLWDNSRLCRHLHLPLQSGSEGVLRRMGRRYGIAAYRTLADEIRSVVPEIAITTDIMVGFPGETEAEHLESLAFCESIGFAGMHVFKYSRREGTPAARMAHQIPDPIKKLRSEEMIELGRASAARYRTLHIGQITEVLWEDKAALPGRHKPSTPVWEGLTDNYLRVYAECEDSLANKISAVSIREEWEDGLWAEIVEVSGTCD